MLGQRPSHTPKACKMQLGFRGGAISPPVGPEGEAPGSSETKQFLTQFLA